VVEESISLSQSEINLLKALVEHKVQFLIVGLSSALLQGIPAVTQDIDLWVHNLSDNNFKEAIESVGATYIPPGIVGTNPPLIAGHEFRGIDLVTLCHGLENFEEEFKKSLKVKIGEIEVHVLPLERIIVSKKAANREKDKAVIPMLESALHLKRKLNP
jgi:predicted nucleotidyltransferase